MKAKLVPLLVSAAISWSSPLSAQLGKQVSLVEPNVAADEALLAVPHMNADLVAALKAARPILGVGALDSLLNAKSLTKAQRTEAYGKMFVHVDLNRGTDAEIALVPGVTSKVTAALKAGRPWTSFTQFQAEMTKAANAAEATRLEQYFFIPIELNTFTNDIMDTFASIGVGTRQWKREFAEYRPWATMEQFDREIGKYVRSRPAELQRLKRYVIINK